MNVLFTHFVSRSQCNSTFSENYLLNIVCLLTFLTQVIVRQKVSIAETVATMKQIFLTHTHRQYPTAGQHVGFDLLSFQPGLVHPSIADLVVPDSPRSTISIVVRTPVQHSAVQPRAPQLTRSANLSLPVTWITGTCHRARRETQLQVKMIEVGVCDVFTKDGCRLQSFTWEKLRSAADQVVRNKIRIMLYIVEVQIQVKKTTNQKTHLRLTMSLTYYILIHIFKNCFRNSIKCLDNHCANLNI